MKKQSGILRRLTALALTLCMLATLTAEIFAADIVNSGYCGGEGDGTNLMWTLDSAGTLTISGNGAMADYTDYNSSINHSPWWYIMGIESVVIQSGVTSIGNNAFFSRYSLTSATIPDSVTSIGDGAFQRCSSLVNVTIPNSVTNIGQYAFRSCEDLTSVAISNRLTSIERGMFYDCYNLMSVTIPDSVTSIGASAFYNCNSLTSVRIPDSVTSIGSSAFSGAKLVNIEVSPNNPIYDSRNGCNAIIETARNKLINGCKNTIIPNSVVCIDISAFKNCTGLTDLIIPDSVTRIDNQAFSECGNLTSIAFLGNAPFIYYNAFKDCPTSLTLYYIQGKTGWTDSSSYDASTETWNGYPLKTWNGKSLPAEAKVSVPEDKYCIQVIDETGAPISGATITWNSDSATTDQDGKALFDLFTYANPTIRVSKQGYTTWSNENSDWQKNEKRFERVILYPESYGSLKLQYAKMPGLFGFDNLVTQTKVLNLRNDGALIGDLSSGYFVLYCAAMEPLEAVKYTVYQNTKMIAESLDGTFSKLDVRDFVEGGGCFVRVTDKTGRTVDTHINLQFVKNSVNEDLQFELKGNKISFAVSDDIPYVGGSSLSFELPLEVPVVASATSEKLQFGINLKTNDKTKDEQIDDYIKKIKEATAAGKTRLTKKDINALKKRVAKKNKAKFFKDLDFTFCGYAEADLGSNTASGYMILIADTKIANFEYNTVILWVIPVTIQVGVGCSLEANGTLSYRFDTKTWDGNVFLNPSFALSPFIGVGCSDLIGLGAYGSADMAASWKLFGKNRGLQSLYLTGELGIKGYLGAREAHKAFAHNTWNLYTANSVNSLSLLSGAAWDAVPEASEYTPSDLSYLAEESDWAPASAQTYSTAQAKTAYQTLLQNTYRNAQPVMVSDGSALYAAFVRADAETGARYVALTKFDGNSWSEPVRVDAGAILDDAPQLCTDGQTLWLAYARTTQSPGDSLVTYAKNQNIVVGTVDKDTLAFKAQKTYQSGNYMHLPALSCVNGTPVLAWAESAVTDENSVITRENSTVYLAKYQNGTWTAAEQTASSAKGIASLCIGEKNDATAIAYTADGKLYCGGSLLAENVTGRAVYGRLPGATADSFIWIADGALYDEAANTVPVEGLGRDFAIVDNSIYFNQANGASANLAVLHYDAANDHWSAPILLIGDEKYLENLNVAELNGKTYALGMHTTVTISTDAVDDAKDLVWTQILPVSDLQLSDVSFDSGALVPGETLPVTLTVTNSGDHAVTNLAFTANGTKSAQDCELLPGESADFTVNITCPSEKQTVTFEVQEPGQDDYTPEDNTAACTVGSADAEVELTLIQIGSRKFVQAAVTNRGLETASGSVLFTGPDGEFLAERTFQNLTYGGTVIAEFEPESFADLYGEDVTATVTLQQDEPNTLNNTDSVPVLLTATEILSAERNGTAVTAEIACVQENTRVLCAFYDAGGRLLSTVIRTLQSGKLSTLTFPLSSSAAQAKLFVLDAKNAPAAAGKTVSLNG